jgi:hypothetical protein
MGPLTTRIESNLDSSTPLQRLVESADDLASKRLKRLFAYWDGLRGTRFAPARSDLNPAEMKDQLGWVWLMDVIDGGTDFRFRMGGDRVVQFFGERLSGNTLRAVLPRSPAFFGRFLDLVTETTAARKPVAGGPAQTAYEPRAFLEVEVLLLPLSDDGAAVTGIMGCIEIRPMTRTPDPRD